MIIVVASLLAVLTVPITGRSLAPLAHLQFQRAWLVWVSIVTQLVITVVPSFPVALGQALHLATFVASGAFAWSNRRIAGTVVIALGAALNLTAIAANGGTMPASAWAWRTAGFDATAGGFENSDVVSSARLGALGDVFAVPRGWPFANVFSIGDVIIVLGVGWLAQLACRAPRSEPGTAEPGTAEPGTVEPGTVGRPQLPAAQ